MTSPKIEELKRELARIRKASLEATRNNDFLRVASLTVKAAELNKAINNEQDNLLIASL